jgi:uncharacterized RDD family membrane protein YckC
VARCLAKEPDRRFADYAALRDALLPFSSKEPEPASLKVRASAGWIDYLIAFLVPYVILMLSIGNEEFHFRFFMERTPSSAGHHIAFLSLGLLYFSIVEGIWGAGLGKQLKGLRVVRKNGRAPGIGRAFLRILIPVLCIEGIRVPLLLASISATYINDLTISEIVTYSAATFLCPWIPVLFLLSARRENGFATLWDLVSGTRVVVKPKGSARAAFEPRAQLEVRAEGAVSLGPYRIVRELAPKKWILATDPVLRRQAWLLRRDSVEPSLARRDLGRSGRLRWLQKVETAEATWDAFEATQGVPFSTLVKDGKDGKSLPWGTLRHWLHDLAAELWAATSDQTLPAELSLDHVWITAQGRAVLIDEAWPDVNAPAERIPVGDLAGQQRFLNAIAAFVDATTLPLHARPVLKNLQGGKFEKLSFLTGNLRGLLSRPAEVSKGIRAGSIFMLPLYVWIMFFVGAYQGAEWLYELVGDSVAAIAMAATLLVLGARAVVQLVELPFRTTCSQAIFRLAVINARGEPAGTSQLLVRWAIVWLPLFLPMVFVAQLLRTAEDIAFISLLLLLLLWIGAAVYAALHPNRGLHDRLADTWVVRR